MGTETWNLVSNSGRYVHAIRSDRTLWAWGNNEYGRLGIGTDTLIFVDNKLSPVQVGQYDDWVSVSGADDNMTGAAGLREVSQGLCTLWTWGPYTARNTSEEQSSLPSAVSYKVPGRVGSNLLWKSISSGNSKLVIGWDDSLWSWGRVSKDYIYPQYNLSPLDSHEWVKISASKGGHNLAIKSDGTLWAWGDNAYGQTGLDPDEYVLSYITKPTQVGTHTWKEISAGSGHSLAIRSDDTLWAWGDNRDGQLGDGTTISKSTPVQIGSGKWLTVSAGSTHSLAIMKD
jgi:alpha-tubulin suppressor-like RCC1 family protein